MKKIYISPSDQVKNAYAAGNTTEAIQCRQIATLLVKALERQGFGAKTNLTGSMYERVKESDEFGADLHTCLHSNAFDEEVSGTRLFCYVMGGEGHKACKAIMARLAPITPGTSDGISARPELYECRAPHAPTVYIEIDFHDVDEVALWIINHKEEIAEAIAQGICDYFGVEYKAPATTQDKPQESKLYRVQIGAYSVKANAEAQLAKAKAAGFTDAFITN
ncbi:MAG: N-acetylmuramoyl-L-alanine amidase [Bacteroidales bacterium]|nr:N-acetylmuramoyl-L-alanine amidase [Bacteroidales bacterium]